MAVNAKDTANKFMKVMALGIEERSKYFKVDDKLAKYTKEISERQMEMLARIFLLNQSNITVLAEKMFLSKSTVSIIMNKLIKKGLVTRNYPKEDQDKRKVFFYITDEGRRILNLVSEAKVAEMLEGYKKLNDRGKRLFDEASAVLGTLVDEETIKFHDLVDKLMGDINKTNSLHIKAVAALAQICGPVFKNVFGDGNINGNITEKQFKVLLAIHFLGHNTVTKLERFFSTSGSSVSIIVLRLEKAGYLLKEHNKCQEDRRITYISLTQKGIDILQNLYYTVNERLTEAFEKRSEEEKEKINFACDKLLEAMSQKVGR